MYINFRFLKPFRGLDPLTDRHPHYICQNLHSVNIAGIYRPYRYIRYILMSTHMYTYDTFWTISGNKHRVCLYRPLGGSRQPHNLTAIEAVKTKKNWRFCNGEVVNYQLRERLFRVVLRSSELEHWKCVSEAISGNLWTSQFIAVFRLGTQFSRKCCKRKQGVPRGGIYPLPFNLYIRDLPAPF